ADESPDGASDEIAASFAGGVGGIRTPLNLPVAARVLHCYGSNDAPGSCSARAGRNVGMANDGRLPVDGSRGAAPSAMSRSPRHDVLQVKDSPLWSAAEFRAGAVRIVRETGKPVAHVARDLGINEYTLHN